MALTLQSGNRLVLRLTTGRVGPVLSDATPQGPGEASAGTGTAAARDDHVHPPQPPQSLLGIQSEIDELQRVTHDLHAGQTHTGWDEASASEGGLAVTPGHDNAPIDLTAVRAIGTWVTEITSGLDDSNVLVVRIPHGSDLAHYRLIWDPRYVDYLGSYGLVGSDDDDDPQWDFYGWDAPISNEARSITLQITGTPDHAGSSTFAGVLTGAAAAGVITMEALSAVVRAAIAAGGELNALTPLIEQDLETTTGSTTAEVEVADFTIANSSDIAYVFRVGTHISYIPGHSLYARRVADPWVVGIAEFYSKDGADAGKLYRDLTTAASRRLEIWKVNDVGAFQTVVDQLARPRHR